MLLPQWILASLPVARVQEFFRSTQSASADQCQRVAELCLLEGYISTLHESMMVFMPVSIMLTIIWCLVMMTFKPILAFLGNES